MSICKILKGPHEHRGLQKHDPQNPQAPPRGGAVQQIAAQSTVRAPSHEQGEKLQKALHFTDDDLPPAKDEDSDPDDEEEEDEKEKNAVRIERFFFKGRIP